MAKTRRSMRKSKKTRKMKGGDQKVYKALNKTLNTMGYSNVQKNMISDNISSLINKVVSQIESQKRNANTKESNKMGVTTQVNSDMLDVTITIDENDKETIDTLILVFGQQGLNNTAQNKAIKGVSAFARSLIGMKNRTLGKEKTNEILRELRENGSYTDKYSVMKPLQQRLLRFASL